MIHVEVGPAPDEFINTPLRKREVGLLRTWLDSPADGRPPAPALSGRYRSVPGLMGKLEAAFAHKCAFCEVGIAPGAGEIMFYRPVGSPGVRIDPSAYYYPWLAWDWSNFCLACRDCMLVREPGFKVVQKAVPDGSHLEQENAAFYAGLEDPYLLNPRIDTPIAFLQFGENGEILAREGSERGRYTVANLKLNRPALVQKRKEAAQTFKQLWLAARTLSLADTADSMPLLIEAVSMLAVQCQGSTTFGGMKAYLLIEWIVGETRIALDSASYFAAAIQRAPWLQAYQAATATLGIQKRSSAQDQISVERPAAELASAPSGSTHTSVTHIYIKGDMYQIGSIRGERVTVGRNATTADGSRDRDGGGSDIPPGDDPTGDGTY